MARQASYTVHLNPTIPARIVPAAACKHEGPVALTIGGRIVKRGHTCDAALCLACGTVTPVSGEYRHFWDALNQFWRAFGWHKTIGQRLVEFADASTSTRQESFFALIHGQSPDEHRAYMEAA